MRRLGQCKVLYGIGLLGRGLVLFPTSDARGVSTMLLPHIKYRIIHMLCPALYAAITHELIFLETLSCIFFKCVSLPTRCDFIAIML